MSENSDLRSKLDQKQYAQTYKDNERLVAELRAMYILAEENKDLREELELLRNISYDQKVKDINAQNQQLMRRNG